MRIVNWNIEWMNDWFVGGNHIAFRSANPGKGISNVAALCQRVAGVIGALQPDLLTVQEGPSDRAEMELFVQQHLGGAYQVLGGLDGRAQKIYALVRHGGRFQGARLASDGHTRALIEPWEADVDGDLNVEPYEFTRVPLVIEGDAPNLPGLRVVILHTKSKYVHEGEQQWNDPATRPQFIRAALINRRRISSEAMRCRRLLDAFLEQPGTSRVVVTGDFNDGPGVDYFEQRYLTHNVTDILLGSSYRADQLFDHPLFAHVGADERYTAIFDDFVDQVPNRRILLDHILVAPAIRPRVSLARVAHEEFDQACGSDWRTQRQNRPSDHRPVVVEFAA